MVLILTHYAVYVNEFLPRASGTRRVLPLLYRNNVFKYSICLNWIAKYIKHNNMYFNSYEMSKLMNFLWFLAL